MNFSKLLIRRVLSQINIERNFGADVVEKMPFGRVAIVGSGPAAFYCVQSLFRRWDSCSIDMFEKLPVPYGLVRFGVAPDHPEVKNCINQFERTVRENTQQFNFYGNVEIGKDIGVKDLMQAYHVVVLAYGSESDKCLHIPGEHARNCLSARSFVGWYNGHPDMVDLQVDLTSSDTAVVFGHGNVALDVARILLMPIDVLAKTDITEHALESLKKSKIKRVFLVGRRGPLQVSFTIAELREMIHLAGCRPIIEETDFNKFNKKFVDTLERPRRRLTQLMIDTALAPGSTSTEQKSWHLKFLRSPNEVLIESERVVGVKLMINKLSDVENNKHSQCRTIPLNEFETINCGLVLFSVGYQTVNADKTVLPFDDKAHVIKTDDTSLSKVKGLPGVYACGWCAKGPVGVLATTQNHAKIVAERIVSDVKDALVDVNASKSGFDSIQPFLVDKNIPWITWNNWKNIDTVEQRCGQFVDKPRKKIIDRKEFLKQASDLKV